jgi:hypothetical protein
MITSLSKEDEARIPEVREKWISIGLSNNTNKELAEAALPAVYESYGKHPETVFWFASPLSGVIGIELVHILIGAQQEPCKKTPEALKDIFKATYTTLATQMATQYEQNKLSASLKKVCEDCLKENEGLTLQEALEKRMDSIGYKLSETSSNLINNCAYGTQDAGFLSFYDFFKPLLPEIVKPLNGLINISQHCGWWWPYDEMVVLTEKPTQICLDNEKRLHCEDNYAIKFSDGWGFCCWHGTRLTEESWILDKESIDPMLALTHENSEMARIISEILGWDKIFTKLVEQGVGLEKVQEDNYGVLYHVTGISAFENGETRFVNVKCPTGRQYYLPVDIDTKTAHEGVASTFNMTAEEYHPVDET